MHAFMMAVRERLLSCSSVLLKFNALSLQVEDAHVLAGQSEADYTAPEGHIVPWLVASSIFNTTSCQVLMLHPSDPFFLLCFSLLRAHD